MEDEFFKDIHKKECLFNENQFLVDDIEVGVRRLLEHLLNAMGQKLSLFSGSKLVPGGSYYEGTKVRHPDEFDYMLVLKPPHFAEEVRVVSGCYPWFKHIRIDCSEGTVDENYPLMGIGLIEHPNKFEAKLWRCIRETIEKEQVIIETTLGTIRTKEVKNRKLYLHFVQRVSDISVQSSTKNPSGIIHIPDMHIGVDLMLAYQHPCPRDILKDIAFPKMFESYLETHGCHFVTKSCKNDFKNTSGTAFYGGRCDCWFLSFSAIETHVMQELDVGHKQCYQVMKSLLIGSADYPGKCMNLSSYMLKTAMLYHVHLDPKCQEMKYSVCVPQILCYLRNGFENVSMPCFLSRNQHVWGNSIAAPMLKRSFLLNTDLQKVFGHYELNNETVYAMLWVEFWRRAIMVIEGLLSTESLLQGFEQEHIVLHELTIFRALVAACIKLYCSPSINVSSMDRYFGRNSYDHDSGQSSFETYHSFKTVKAEVRDIFPQYISDWREVVQCDWFDKILQVDPVPLVEILYQRC